ncbi:hypothetical protein [Pseudoalteromonas sp. MMG024]|uniref:hypothetical protein n=1 Tax=Pseudoalteromonas sp. MMG024 TaxID=2909980 RepID=UPI001F33A9C2|nr:hypothetical protein [Pseudoalteromonas sp. MMG024]MCF6459057.1 hypothetical protein [Pseudoalteromonas sp. MMG024]
MTAILFNLLYLLVAVVTVFVALRIRDKLLAVSFRNDVYPILKKSPLALAVFYGAWVLGVCHLAARMLGLG